ncbi:MAG: helix-turn-helix domain-containing protein [Acidimicrobiales bacterium]
MWVEVGEAGPSVKEVPHRPTPSSTWRSTSTSFRPRCQSPSMGGTSRPGSSTGWRPWPWSWWPGTAGPREPIQPTGGWWPPSGLSARGCRWALADRVGIDRRQLVPAFRRTVGVVPKRYQRPARFQSTLWALRRAGGVSLAEVEVVNGCADQAHLTREIRALTGVTPTALLALGAEGINHLPTAGAGTGGGGPYACWRMLMR